MSVTWFAWWGVSPTIAMSQASMTGVVRMLLAQGVWADPDTSGKGLLGVQRPTASVAVLACCAADLIESTGSCAGP